MLTRLIAIGSILAAMYLGLMLFLSQLGGAGFWETVKESWETVCVVFPALAVSGGFLYLVAVALTGSWAL